VLKKYPLPIFRVQVQASQQIAAHVICLTKRQTPAYAATMKMIRYVASVPFYAKDVRPPQRPSQRNAATRSRRTRHRAARTRGNKRARSATRRPANAPTIWVVGRSAACSMPATPRVRPRPRRTRQPPTAGILVKKTAFRPCPRTLPERALPHR